MRLDRVRQPELMDDPAVDPVELGRGLRDLGRVNRWLRGTSLAVSRVLDIAGRVASRPVEVVDVGTGAADIPIALVGAARARGIDVRITGVDLHPETLAYARAAAGGHPQIRILGGDALSLPFPDGRFDIAMCSTMLHHLTGEDAIRTLIELGRVARWGVVVTDLARSRPALLGAQLLSRTIWRSHAVTRHDGPASVRAAFTPQELEALAVAALGRNYRIEPAFPFRLVLVVDWTRADGSQSGPARDG